MHHVWAILKQFDPHAHTNHDGIDFSDHLGGEIDIISVPSHRFHVHQVVKGTIDQSIARTTEQPLHQPAHTIPFRIVLLIQIGEAAGNSTPDFVCPLRDKNVAVFELIIVVTVHLFVFFFVTLVSVNMNAEQFNDGH